MDLIRGDQGDIFDKQTLMNTISSLNKREFLMHSVHEKQPQFFRTRWALSYLCGPLTRTQIKTLMTGKKPIPRNRSRTFTSASFECDRNMKQDAPPRLTGHDPARIMPPLISRSNRMERLFIIYISLPPRMFHFLITNMALSARFLSLMPCRWNTPLVDISWTQSRSFSFKADVFAGIAFKEAAYMPVRTGCSQTGN